MKERTCTNKYLRFGVISRYLYLNKRPQTHESISSLFDGFGPFPSIVIINFASYCLKNLGSIINPRAVKIIHISYTDVLFL